MKKIILITLLFVFTFALFGCQKTESDKLTIAINPGVDTVEVFTSFQDKGAVASIGKSIVAVSTTSNVDTTKVGTYTITYKATYEGTTVTAVRKVTVVDETSPSLSLNPGIDTIVVGATWTDAGVSAVDNSMGEVTITVSGTVNANEVGEYIITYTGTDQSGNASSIVRYVNVVGKN